MKDIPLLDPVTRWIKLRTGIETTQVNRGRVALAVQELATDRDLPPEEYIHQVLGGHTDAQDLIDRVITAESYFLRHVSTMSFVVREVVPELLKKEIRPRILSAPCARGEEPYSLAMMLADAGIQPHRVSITAIDISRNCILQAREGAYESYSFRRVDPEFLRRHFLPHPRGFRVHPAYIPLVSFERMNLLEDAVRELAPGFHAIFCQNLMIYFDEETSRRLLSVLDHLLAPDGWLFVDSAEGTRAKERFHRFPADNMFGFKKLPYTGERKDAGTGIRKPLAEQGRATPWNRSNHRKHAPPSQGKRIPVLGKGPPRSPENRSRGPQTFREIPDTDQGVLSHSLEEAEAAHRRKDLDTAFQTYVALADSGARFCARALLGLARVQADRGNTLEAMEYAESALNRNEQGQGTPLTREEEAQAHAVLGLAMLQKGLPTAAGEHFSRIRELDPFHPALRVVEDTL
jgi:chemotaxis protein methyltransferase WspC